MITFRKIVYNEKSHLLRITVSKTAGHLKAEFDRVITADRSII